MGTGQVLREYCNQICMAWVALGGVPVEQSAVFCPRFRSYICYHESR